MRSNGWRSTQAGTPKTKTATNDITAPRQYLARREGEIAAEELADAEAAVIL